MKLFTFPQKKLARLERNLEDLELSHIAILRYIDRLRLKLEKEEKKLRQREKTIFHTYSVITDLKNRFGNSKSSRLDEKIKATLIETSVVHPKIKRWGVIYKSVK